MDGEMKSFQDQKKLKEYVFFHSSCIGPSDILWPILILKKSLNSKACFSFQELSQKSQKNFYLSSKPKSLLKEILTPEYFLICG